MNKKYFLDTNIFLRIIIKEDENSFLECTNLIKLIESGKVIAKTSSIVLSEVVWTMRSYYKLSKEDVLEAVQSILTLRNLKMIDSYEIEIALELYRNNNVKFIDTLIASIPDIKNNKLLIISYDKDFDKLPVKRINPDDASITSTGVCT